MLALEGKIGAVVHGKNGRLFLGDQDGFNIGLFTNGHALTGGLSRAWRRTIQRRARLLADRGIPYVIYICPDAH